MQVYGMLSDSVLKPYSLSWWMWFIQLVFNRLIFGPFPVFCFYKYCHNIHMYTHMYNHMHKSFNNFPVCFQCRSGIPGSKVNAYAILLCIDKLLSIKNIPSYIPIAMIVSLYYGQQNILSNSDFYLPDGWEIVSL